MTSLRVTAIATAFLLGAANAASPASAATTINLTGSSGTSGTAGNTRVFSAGTGADAVTVTASGWTMDATLAKAAYLGAYSNGLGVTNGAEGSGGNGTHTIDNAGSVDFVLLRFNKAVSLLSASLSAYGDTDVTFASFSSFPSGTVVPLSQLQANLTSTFTSIGGTSSRTATNSTSIFSSAWAVSSAVRLTSSSLALDTAADSFKLRAISVQAAPAVPEPSTWAMMLVGFGAIGVAMRRRHRQSVTFAFA